MTSRKADQHSTINVPTAGVTERAADDMHSATQHTSMADASPFLLSVHDKEILAQSSGFRILREHLAEHYQDEYVYVHTSPALITSDKRHRLCEAHAGGDLAQWLIVRDVLHALLVPIVELFDKACTCASQATHASKLEDLEYAFSSNARSAFVWLQCFLSSERERDWCYTRGCPACVVDHSLDSEFSIRLLYGACLLSDVHYPFTLEGPTLPSFIFFLDSLERAIEQDALYGADFYELMQPKAQATRDGIEDLIHQTLELDITITQNSSPSSPSSPIASEESTPVLGPVGGTPGMKVKRSKMARRQMRLKVEEEAWMEEMLKKLALERDALAAVPTQSLDAVLKAGSVVEVTELPPATSVAA